LGAQGVEHAGALASDDQRSGRRPTNVAARHARDRARRRGQQDASADRARRGLHPDSISLD